MLLKEFKMLSAVFVFVLVAGLVFMLQSHSEENAYSEIAYIDEFQVVAVEDEQTDIKETDVPSEQFAALSPVGEMAELLGFMK